MPRLLILSLCLLTPSVAHASWFSDLIIFGDSLSDIGNTSAATFGIVPGGGSFQGRFSNGPIYADLLSESLGFGTLTRSGEGGDNYSFGGAETAGPGGLRGLFLNGFDEQVEEYTTNRDADANALHIIWMGANDLLDGQMNFQIPAENIAGEIANLHADGARRFLVINLPDLGVTPRFNIDPLVSADYSARSRGFNIALDTALDGVEASLADIELLRFDVDSVFSELLADPAAFGLTNTTEAADEVGAANPDEFLFWDSVHPTTVVHALFADELSALLAASVVDANEDDLVTGADYTLLRDTSAPGLAIEEWSASFSPAAFVLPASTGTIPEPATTTLVVIGVLVVGTARLQRAPAALLTRG